MVSTVTLTKPEELLPITVSLKPELHWYQIKDITKNKNKNLQTNIAYECRCKTAQQNTSQLNSVTSKKKLDTITKWDSSQELKVDLTSENLLK